MPKTRTGEAAERAALDTALEEARGAAEHLRGLVDRDTAAYDAVVAAYRLAKGTDAEKSARKEAIAAALKVATDVPLGTALECLRVIRAAGEALRNGNPNAASDAKTAAALALAGLQGAVENVRANAAQSQEAARAAVYLEEGIRKVVELGLLPG
jgi:formiminotetrahydrofolate cyclodeaminase